MGDKARKKFAELHEAYEKARSVREFSSALDRTAAVDEAAVSLASDDGLSRVEAQLAALDDERKALRKLVKFARKKADKLVAAKPAKPDGAAKRARPVKGGGAPKSISAA
ncbi:hypothetical protein SLNSH_07825 [Alsobacter soli]|uniref:Uncharacterized protein n=1 Tax=Alsobacter soli TaxID=2109933 RepID=A0A2T1HV23_9HYPH|nr:hypothetical protein [Alsobacter soli]PSC05491.1 hypothetical protein SLNSH_07825 [Alsobacter soli]